MQLWMSSSMYVLNLFNITSILLIGYILPPEDIVGKSNFIDANGDVSVGTIIILRKVKIGNKVLTNVEASVVNNLNAPLLIGQSALEKFDKISIDYGKSQITFE